MTSCGMGYTWKIEGEMTQALHLSILQDEVIKITEWYHFNLSHVIFQHDNDHKHPTNLVKRCLSIQFFVYLLGLLNHPNQMEHVWALVTQKLNEYTTPTKGML